MISVGENSSIVSQVITIFILSEFALIAQRPFESGLENGIVILFFVSK